LLINLLDASSSFIDQQNETVLSTLQELKIENQPILTVLNKKDLIRNKFLLERLRRKFPEAVFISALTGEGLKELKERIAKNLPNHELTRIKNKDYHEDTKTRKTITTLTTNKILPQRHQDSKHSKKKFIYNSW